MSMRTAGQAQLQQPEYCYTREDKRRMRPVLSCQLCLRFPWPTTMHEHHHNHDNDNGSRHRGRCCVERVLCNATDMRARIIAAVAAEATATASTTTQCNNNNNSSSRSDSNSGGDEVVCSACRIVALSADPHLHLTYNATTVPRKTRSAEHEDGTDNDGSTRSRQCTRRVCVTVTTRSHDRVRLPLDAYAVRAAPHTCDVHVSYWRACAAQHKSSNKSNKSSNNEDDRDDGVDEGAVPLLQPCAAVLVGDVAALSQCAVDCTTRTRTATSLLSPSSSLLQAWWFASVPYKVLWLCSTPHRLLVSLPCEERIVTLDATPSPSPASAAVTTMANATRQAAHEAADDEGDGKGDHAVPTTCVHSCYTFARGVVPLDMAELPSHHLIAVTTYEHGVLLCALDATCAVLCGVLRSVTAAGAVAGGGGAVRPLTCVAALWPRVDAPTATAAAATATAAVASAAVTSGSTQDAHRQTSMHVKAETHNDVDVSANAEAQMAVCHSDMEAMEAVAAYVNAGAVLCSCVYDIQSSLVKLAGGGGAGDGVVEDVQATSGATDALLHTSPCVDVDVGTLACTTGKSLLCLHVVPAVVTDRRDGRRGSACRADACRSDRDGSTPAAQRTMSRRGVLVDGVPSTVTVQRLLHLQGRALLRSGDGVVVRQGRTYTQAYVARYRVVRHWQLCVDSHNVVYLLDRNLTQYSVHSCAVVTRVRACALGDVKAVATGSVSQPQQQQQQQEHVDDEDNYSHRDRRSRSSSSSSSSDTSTKGTARKRQRRAARAPRSARSARARRVGRGGCRSEAEMATAAPRAAATTTTVVNVEALVCGLAFVGAADAWLCAAVAHDVDCISLLTWSAQ